MASRRRRLALGSGLVLGTVFLLLQLRQVERTNPPVVSEIQAPPEIREILERACYDCHSHETSWPWYSRVAPLSWWLVDHVEHGRRDLNFSDWPVLDFEEAEHHLRDIHEQIATNEMPLASYKLLHSGARLGEADRQALRAWARSHF